MAAVLHAAPTSIQTHLRTAANGLSASSDSAALDARLLLAHVLQVSESWLLAHADEPLTESAVARFAALLTARQAGKPIAHLIGMRAFWTLDLQVNASTLIPRPDTELLVSTLLELGSATTPMRLLDLGTGTGAIALALASERPHWDIHATDCSHDALALARSNAARYELNMTFHHGDWFDALPADAQWQVIVSNPPYIAEHDPHLLDGDVRFEPRLALTSGPDGLTALRHIIAQAPKHLTRGGLLLVEHGFTQAAAVRVLFAEAGFAEITSLRDLGNNERVTLGYWHGC
jgi:release factor glutamine methyltransferase